MNKHLYRIIFNSARGMLMVVAEIARSGRPRTARRRSPLCGAEVQVRLSPLSLLLWLAAGLVSLPAQADIVADVHAPGNQQPTVLSTANGLPQVNIQTPNDQGVSRNQYTQFDVDARGAILNNSHKNTATQQAGMVAGNPWLAKQEARIILNEVNSRNPSQLNGFIEVAGRRAEVVIANPSGITCAGCGFINASRSTLAAGQVLMENGQLKGFDVGGGRINIEGKGLNAGDADYTALIARAVVVNGKVHARELTVTTGKNVTDTRGSVTRVRSPASEGKPAFALDVAALGGMYANKITLVGTEKGLGVRNAGELGAGAGELTLTVDGKLDNRGQLQSQGNLRIASQGDLNNPGSLVAGKEVSLSATGTLRNEGLIRAGGNATLIAGRIESTSGSHLAAGVDAQGGITRPGNLVLTATGELKAQGQNLAQNLLAARGSRVDMGGSQTTAGTVALTATQGDVRTTGATLRAESANIQAATGFNNDDGQLSAGTLSLQAQSIDNNRGLLRQENAQDLTLDSGVIRNNQGTLTNGGNTLIRADLVENRGGMLAGNGRDLRISTSLLDNQQGTVQLSGDGTMSLHADRLQGHQGTLHSAGKLTLTGHDLDLSAGHSQAQQLVVTADTLNNRNGLLSQRGDGDMTLTLRDSLNNHAGRAESGGNLTLSATGLDNTGGTLLAANRGNLNLNTTGDITSTRGRLLAGGAVNLTANQLDTQGGLISATGGDATLSLSQGLNNAGGRIEAKNAVETRSQSLNNAAGTLLGQRVSVDTRQGQLTNTGGRIVAEGPLQMASGVLDNTGGRLQSGGDLHLNTHGQILTNTRTTSAGILSGGTLSLITGDIDNTQGVMAAAGEARVNSQQFTNTAGKLLADQALTLVTRAVNNAGGLVQSGARLFLDTQGEQLTNTDSGKTGGLVARGDLQINAGQLDGRQGVILGQNVRLDTHQQAFSHQGGQLMAREALRLDTGQLDNSAGHIQSGNDGQLDTHGQTLTNRESGKTGGILTGGALTLRTGDIDNQRGTLIGHGNITVAAGTLDNRAGTLASDTAHLSLTVGETHNQGGLLQATTALTLDTQGQSLFNADSGESGGIRSQGTLTLTSGTFDNQRGVVVSSDMARLTTTDLNNQQGQLTGHGGLNLATHTLTNTAGRLQSDADLTMNTQGYALDNADSGEKGGIVTLKDLHLSSGHLNNQAGFIAAGGQADLITTTLNNRHGQVAGNGGLSLHSQALDNADGKLQSAANVLIDTAGHTLDNQRGHIVGDGQTRIDSGALDNQYGHLQGGTDLAVNTHQNALDNQHGTLLSAGALTLNAGQLNNQSGELTGQGDGQLTLTQQLDNTQGRVRAGQALAITAAQVINRDTNTPSKGIEAGSLTMSTQTLDNTHGALRATVQLTSTVRQALENVAGLVSSGGVLTVRDDAQGQQLSINNREGTLIAGTDGQITAATLSGDGQVLSQGDLAVHLAHDFHNTRTVGANGNMTLETPAAIVNDGRITAGDTLTVTGQQVTNTAQAEISAQATHVNAQDTLTNTGLIDGSLTHLTAGTLTNTGTGRIYGDHVALQAGTLNNLSSDDKAAVIAARERLDIGAGTVNNRDHALITSLGDLYIGGQLDGQYQATGQGAQLNNHGATIEAGRDGSINMREVNNTNRHLVTEVVQTEKSQHHEAVLKGQTTRYDWDKVDTSKKNKYGVHTAVMPDGSRNDEFYEYQYTRTVMETQIRDSDPGKILAGGNLTLNGDRVANHDSQIVAGGTLGGTVGEVDNQATKGDRVTTDDGWQKRWYAKKKKKKIGGTKTSQGRSTSDYRPAPVTETLDLKTLTWQGDTAPDGSGYQAGGRQTAWVDTAVASVDDIDAVRPGAPVMLTTLPGGTVTLTGLAEIKDRPLVLPAGQQFALTLPSTLVDGQPVTPVIRVVAPNTRLPDNSLFTLHQSIDSHYLVETDPQFTRQKQWLGSDYMQNALLSDPSQVHKRLGDGYYEQGLIRDQVTQLTGSRYLAGYGSDEEQYKGLMNNGIAFGREYGLELGVALTPAQMALLTTDMVWLVNQTVTLPDGSTQTVQVPQVYAKVKDGDLTGDGALLGGKQVVLNTRGDITNSGSIIGREVTQLTAQILTNSGYIQGNRVDLSARQDIYNTGGQLRGESSLSLLAGRDITSQTTTRTDGTDRWLDRPAGMYVQAPNGTLTLSALNNITLSATELSNAGENGTTSVQAGNDLRLESVATRHSEHGDWGGGNTRDLTQQADVGTRITTPGAIALDAGRDITARAAEVIAGGALTVQAGRDIRLTTGNATTDLVEHSKQSSSGLLSKSSIETHDEVHDRQALGATLSGNSVDIRAKHDVRIEAGNVVGTQDVKVLAGNNLTVTTADETHHETHLRKETQSGLLSSGGMGFTVGAKKESWDDASQARNGKASLVGSLKGDTVLLAGQHYQQTGSTVSSPAGNVVIRGKSVAVEAGKNLNASQYAHTLEQKGFTLAVNVPVVQAVQGAAQTVQRVGKSNDDRVNMLAAANAAWDSARTANSLMNSAQGLMDNGAQGVAQNVSISLTYGEKKQEDTRNTNGTTAQASKINAGKHAVLIATGGEQSDITVTGSDIGGKQGTRLQADHDITLQAASQEQHERTDNRSSGWNAGIAASYGQNGAAFGITAGASLGKGHGNGDDHTWRNSHIGDMNGQTQVTSRGTATLKGAQVSGSGVSISADNLTIESLQDTMTYAGKQQDMSGQVTVGYGVSGSGSFSQSNVNADYASVQEQSGIFAGKNGYQIDIRDHTDLTGGLITSSDSAEQSGLNRFSTGTLSWQDIRNHADYSGNSVGISGSASMNADLGLGKNAAAQSDKVSVDKDGESTPATGMASLNKTMTTGIGHDSGSEKSTTHSGINTGNIVITRPDAQQQAVEGVKTDITTETAAENAGRLKNNFDKDKVFKELNLQVAVTKDFSANANRQIGEYVDDKQAAARQALKEAMAAGDAVKQQQALDDIYKLQYQRRFLQVLVGVVAGSPDTAITQQTLAIAATKMREETIKNSFIFPGVADQNDVELKDVLSNVSGKSDGSYDGIKAGGARLGLDVVCGKSNDRCKTQTDPSGKKIMGEDGRPRLEFNAQGMVIFTGDEKFKTLKELLGNKDMFAQLSGATGGNQGSGGTMAGRPYEPGGFWDTVVEGFAGTHDFIGGQLPGFYDSEGNATRGRGTVTDVAADVWAGAAIPLAAPFAVSEIVSPELLEFIFAAGK
ncbi:hemagglutinin repeat-containing protein [Escherichia coli]|nr:filamentous hemagglutinin N-terminal domain-containing protein [Escherichia coli]EHZ8215181.1 hemagglutinin repeat-containing protein [Escherichia coli]ELM5076848.1 hemagglutinin repeat-containing protein [Escherichia coli]HDU8580771.1 hemagglutinin repeat-containing protein [Morganella morganii]